MSKISAKTNDNPLIEELSDTLHALAQPLTILTATAYSAKEPMSEAALAEAMRTMSQEVLRLSVYFYYLQQFVLQQTTQPTCERDDVLALITHSMQGVDLLFAEAGASFALEQGSENEFWADVDPPRFEEALTRIFTVIRRFVSEGDGVMVKVDPHERTVCILFDSHGVKPPALGADSRLPLRLAGAVLRTQGLSLSWESNPFSACIRFPSIDATAVK